MSVPESLRSRLSYLLGSLYYRSLELESDELGAVRVGVKQQAALDVLVDEGAMTQQRLGRRLGIDRTTIVGVVDGLEELGYVERTRDTADRRAYLIALTRVGRSAQRRGRGRVHRAEGRLLDGLSEPDRRRLVDLLARALPPRAAEPADPAGPSEDLDGEP